MIRKTIALRGHSISYKEAGHRSKVKATYHGRAPILILLISRSFHAFLISSSSRLLARALNASSALHHWPAMAHNASSRRLPESAKLSAAGRKGEKESHECISGWADDPIDMQHPTERTVIEWHVMETSMEDGLLGRAALSRNEISGWKQKGNAESFSWSTEAATGWQGWRKDPAPRRAGHMRRNLESDHPCEDSKQVPDKDLSHHFPCQSASSTSKTVVDSYVLEDDDHKLEAFAGCAETCTSNLEVMGNSEGYDVSRRLRSREKIKDGCFPPPLTSFMGKGCYYLPQQQMPTVLLHPTKSDGRFVLRKVEVSPQTNFQHIRTQNRLILHLINPKQPDQPLSRHPNFQHLHPKQELLVGKDVSVLENRIQKQEASNLKNADQGRRCASPLQTAFHPNVPDKAEVAGTDLPGKEKSCIGFDGGIKDLHPSANSFLKVCLISKAVSGLEANLPQSRCKRFDLFEEDSVLPIWERQCIASS